MNIPAFLITLVMTGLLIRGTKESILLNTVIVIIKLAVIVLFLVVGFGHIDPGKLESICSFRFFRNYGGSCDHIFCFHWF
jgi:APA family basic amino acid/polyamine antiporter